VMDKISDFKCVHSNADDISLVSDDNSIKFPQAYQKAEDMAELALKIKTAGNSPLCILPFCHTIEAECFGAFINFGDALFGPRVKEYKVRNIKDLEMLLPIDFTMGRIAEVISACKMLKQAGETVCLEISGPMTILNNLIELKEVFKAWRKDKEYMLRILDFLNGQMLIYADIAKNYADIICYADPIASIDILGPNMAKEWTEFSTVPFLKKLLDCINNYSVIQICPKITVMLIGFGFARYEDFYIPEPMKFSEACIKYKDIIKITGQNCVKNKDYIVGDKFKEIILN